MQCIIPRMIVILCFILDQLQIQPRVTNPIRYYVLYGINSSESCSILQDIDSYRIIIKYSMILSDLCTCWQHDAAAVHTCVLVMCLLCWEFIYSIIIENGYDSQLIKESKRVIFEKCCIAAFLGMLILQDSGTFGYTNSPHNSVIPLFCTWYHTIVCCMVMCLAIGWCIVQCWMVYDTALDCVLGITGLRTGLCTGLERLALKMARCIPILFQYLIWISLTTSCSMIEGRRILLGSFSDRFIILVTRFLAFKNCMDCCTVLYCTELGCTEIQ